MAKPSFSSPTKTGSPPEGSPPTPIHAIEEKYDRDTGFFGFYECIDDLDVSKALFETAREWLRAKGKKKMNGPQSFTVYDVGRFRLHQ